MIPENRRSSEVISGSFEGARDKAYVGSLVDYEDGGIAIQDPSKGLRFQTWKAFRRVGMVNGSELHSVVVEDEKGETAVLYQGFPITELSFTFDQNMYATLAFVEGGQAKLRWFNPLVPGVVVIDLDADVTHPRVSLDDKHPLGLPSSDVILAYQKNDKGLYVRAQRDRYEVEYELAAEAPGELFKIGLNVRNRMQFAFATCIDTVQGLYAKDRRAVSTAAASSDAFVSERG